MAARKNKYYKQMFNFLKLLNKNAPTAEGKVSPNQVFDHFLIEKNVQVILFCQKHGLTNDKGESINKTLTSILERAKTLKTIARKRAKVGIPRSEYRNLYRLIKSANIPNAGPLASFLHKNLRPNEEILIKAEVFEEEGLCEPGHYKSLIGLLRDKQILRQISDNDFRKMPFLCPHTRIEKYLKVGKHLSEYEKIQKKLNDKVEELETINTNLESKIKSNEATLKMKDDKIDSLEKRVRELEDQLKINNSRLENHDSRIEKTETAITDLKKMIETGTLHSRHIKNFVEQREGVWRNPLGILVQSWKDSLIYTIPGNSGEVDKDFFWWSYDGKIDVSMREFGELRALKKDALTIEDFKVN